MSEGFTPTPPMEEGGPPGEDKPDEEARRHLETAQEVEAAQAAERAETTQEGAEQEAQEAQARSGTSVGPQQRPGQEHASEQPTPQEDVAREA